MAIMLQDEAPIKEETDLTAIEPADSVRSDLESAWDELEAQDTSTSDTSTPDSRARDELGRFARKEAEEKAAAEQVTDQGKTQPLEPQSTATVEAPASWKAETKARFAELPPDIQAVVSEESKRQQAFFTQKSQELAQIRRGYEDLDKVLAPHVEKFALQGLHMPQVVNQLIAAQNYLDRDPVEGLKWLAQSYGIDLRQLSHNEAPAHVNPQLEGVTREVQELRNYIASHQEAQQEHFSASLENDVVTFAQVDATGQSALPHFEKVWPEMVPIVSYLRQSKPTAPNQDILKEAYDRAIYANPEIRQTLLSEQSTKSESERLAAQKQKVAQAKRAGSSLSGAPGAGSLSRPPASSVREELERAFEELG